MRYLSFEAEGKASYGIAADRGVHDLGARIGSVLPDLKSYLKALELGLVSSVATNAFADYATGDIAYLPTITVPGKIICVGLNYEGHRLETGRPKQTYPTLFARFADTLIGHGGAIRRPSVSEALDFEGELAVVIGRSGFRIPKEEASSFIAGYSCFNDASLRDFQNHTHQFMPGKNFPATGAFGPELVTPDEVGALDTLKIETRLNGDVVQQAKLEELLFSVEDLIAYVSIFTALSPGDVLVTGTPGGVGFKRTPPLYMKPGDVVEVEIDKVGQLRNEIAEELPKG
ncbi:fumarylacetoacetate hydrolase family protein [Aminobacter aminovorans]|jgi:2-keto-4-pentenoate hydratase/2-oxohepta-3-ene-1,7-dioic acid hydratase in catechol pathway|uniref:2-keto-4-pentenoate hydratase/2-oxohepta-3-ene-1,7-dioic acid hydratase in catechol pathway n=1 Tax=Aminobacter aminovorans TaxID=83263 RepID=A0AAC9ATN5_AMIAI|nr:fumarylacetoacetate hydrolase family protein [Aminobacter aminovorans]AMS44998.1 5-carboxymethyl-2-hydroxymuconate isomerase [Aminobacter aminovorans]MBB3710091.1 2-keto-4-pentenoate hydratase/2-oxohepta-3-ene-1,7-dioic acid hydratase in catechol pathway [Aminobacter aminovorans]